jgi:hypothetical protein
MERKMQPVFDPKLQDEIPAWVITHIAEVSAWMKTRGHKQWSIGGVGPNAEVPTLREWIKETGEQHNICTRNVLGEVCDGCRCKRAANTAISRPAARDE